ncbi:MAG: VWA domain-containing protein [Bacteroidota bacterium]
MAFNDFQGESPSNYEQKCTCVMVLDVSGSMKGEPIDKLNQGLQDFYQDIQGDLTTSNRLELSIVTFGSKVDCLVEPSLADNITLPTLIADGSTKLVDGVRKGIEVALARKKWYNDTGQPYYRPWVILITDGEPDKNQDVDGLRREIEMGVQGKSFLFFAIGVEQANMEMLNTISTKTMPPAKLAGLKFSEFFNWLSNSMDIITSSEEGQVVNLPNTTWTEGFTI